MRLRTVLIVLGGTALVAVGGGAALWFSEPVATVVDVDEAAVASGAGAAPIAHGLDLEPRDLDAARALWEPAELLAARARLEDALPGGEHEGSLRVLLSVVCRRWGDAEAALEYGQRGAELLAGSGHAHHVYARAIGERMRTGGVLAAMRNLKPWRKELRAAIELDPSNVQARAEEFFFYAYVPGPMGGDSEHALALAIATVEFDAPLGLSLQARALQKLEREDEALACCNDGLQRFPRNASLLLALGNLHEDAADWAAADAAYATVPEPPEDESGWRALYQRARLRTTEDQLTGEEGEALELLDRYAQGAPRADLMPPPAEVERRRGVALQGLGRIDEARGAYARALELDPANERAKVALGALAGE